MDPGFTLEDREYSPEVQNSGINGLTKGLMSLKKFKKQHSTICEDPPGFMDVAQHPKMTIMTIILYFISITKSLKCSLFVLFWSKDIFSIKSRKQISYSTFCGKRSNIKSQFLNISFYSFTIYAEQSKADKIVDINQEKEKLWAKWDKIFWEN